jgi:hypothetical protein
MPFVSKAQIEWAREQVRLGKWTQAKFDEWHAATPNPHLLPDRAPKQPPAYQVARVQRPKK